MCVDAADHGASSRQPNRVSQTLASDHRCFEFLPRYSKHLGSDVPQESPALYLEVCSPFVTGQNLTITPLVCTKNRLKNFGFHSQNMFDIQGPSKSNHISWSKHVLHGFPSQNMFYICAQMGLDPIKYIMIWRFGPAPARRSPSTNLPETRNSEHSTAVTLEPK